MAVITRDQLPHNVEAEKAVLGAMFRSKECLHNATARLKETDFFDEANRTIYRAILKLYKENNAIDIQTVVNELINSNDYEPIGGIEYLAQLVDAIITFSNVGTYINNIRDTAILRSFLVTLDEIQVDYLKTSAEDPNEFLNIAETKINRVTETRNVADFRTAKDIASVLSTELENLKQSDTDDQVTGVPTGFHRLNRATHGFQKGNYIVVAARTGIGKTTFCLNLAYNAASRGFPVAYFSLEMRAEDLFKRLVSAESDIPFNTIQSGFALSRERRARLLQSCQSLGQLKFFVEESSNIDLVELVAKIKKLKGQEPDLAVVFVDYVGLVKTSNNKSFDSRTLQIQEISTTLKKVALELEISVVCVAQLNRKVDERGGDPILSDLRESGSLEQDADLVLLLSETKISDLKKRRGGDDANAPSMINEQYDKIAQKAGGDSARVITVNVAKNRAGQQTKFYLIFRKEYLKFDNPDMESERQLSDLEASKSDFLGVE